MRNSQLGLRKTSFNGDCDNAIKEEHFEFENSPQFPTALNKSPAKAA